MASPFSSYRGTAAPAITASQFANAGQQGAMLGQGLAQAGDAIGKVLEQRKADAQETKMLRTMLDTYDPDNKDIHATLGLGELRGKRDAFAMAIARQQQERLSEEHKARMDAYKAAQAAQTALTKSAKEASAAAGKQDLSNLTQSMTRGGMAGPALGMAGFMDPAQRTPVTADALMQAIARNADAINTPFAQQLIMSQAREQERIRKQPELTELGGRDVVFSPDTGAFQILNEPSTQAVVVKRPGSNEPLGIMIGTRFVEDKTKAVKVDALQRRIDNEYKILQGMGYKNKNYGAQQDIISKLNQELTDLLKEDSESGPDPAQPSEEDDPLGLFK